MDLGLICLQPSIMLNFKRNLLENLLSFDLFNTLNCTEKLTGTFMWKSSWQNLYIMHLNKENLKHYMYLKIIL